MTSTSPGLLEAYNSNRWSAKKILISSFDGVYHCRDGGILFNKKKIENLFFLQVYPRWFCNQISPRGRFAFKTNSGISCITSHLHKDNFCRFCMSQEEKNGFSLKTILNLVLRCSHYHLYYLCEVENVEIRA